MPEWKVAETFARQEDAWNYYKRLKREKVNVIKPAYDGERNRWFVIVEVKAGKKNPIERVRHPAFVEKQFRKKKTGQWGKLKRRKNPVAGKLIGQKTLSISTSTGKAIGKMGSIYGLPNGSIIIKGFFSKVPKGNVSRIEYLDAAKAKRLGLKSPSRPWRHDFTREKRPLVRTQGGLLIPAGKRPLWAMHS